MTIGALCALLGEGRLISGEENAHRTMEKVVLLERHRDLYRLEPWEFPLISEPFLQSTGLSLERCIRELSGAVGVGIQQGGSAPRLSLEALELARERGLPILLFPHSLDPGELMTALIDARNPIAPSSLEEFRRELGALLTGGYQPIQIVELLSRYVSGPVDLTLNNTFVSLTHHNSLRIVGIDDIVRTGVGKINSAKTYALFHKQDVCVYIFKVMGHAEVMAYLSITVSKDTPLEENQIQMLREALPALGMALLSGRQLSPEGVSTRDEFFTALLEGLYGDRHTRILEDAAFLGVDHNTDRYTWLLCQVGGREYDQQVLLDTVVPIIRRCAPDYFAMRLTNRLVFVTDLPRPKADFKLTFADICHRLEELLPGIQPRIGVSKRCEHLWELPETFLEARFVLTMGTMLQPETRVFYYGSFSIYHMLCEMWGNPVFTRLYAETVQTLEQWDKAHHSALLETLSCYIGCDCSITAAAEQLGLNRNTVYKRLEKIGDVLHMDLSNPEAKILLELALKIRRISQLYPETENTLNWVL